MKTLLISMMAALVAGAPAFAADMGDMKMNAPSGKSDGKQQTVQGMGVVKSVDPDQGTITLAHEAIPALEWPAMTMRFKIDRQLAATVKPGQRVSFELAAGGMGGTIKKIAVLK